MAITAGNTGSCLAAVVLSLSLSGCGLTQKVTDGTVAVTKSIFYRQVKTLHLDIRAREAVNSNAGGIPLSTVVRIYQLKDRQAFDSTDYPSLFARDSQALKADIVAQKDNPCQQKCSFSQSYRPGRSPYAAVKTGTRRTLRSFVSEWSNFRNSSPAG